MYHDEFARKPAKPRSQGEDLLPSLPLEVGGGLSLGLAASLNQPISILLFYLGGLLPLVTCSLAIAAHRASELLARLAPGLRTKRHPTLPGPHFSAARAPRAATNPLVGSTRSGPSMLHRPAREGRPGR